MEVGENLVLQEGKKNLLCDVVNLAPLGGVFQWGVGVWVWGAPEHPHSQSLALTEVVKCESNCVLLLGLTCGTPRTPSPSL